MRISSIRMAALLFTGMNFFIPFSATPAFSADETQEKIEAETSTEKSETDSAAAAPYRYAPDYCDFEVTFPEKPQTMEKCLPGSGCFELSSYTMVYDLQSTVDVSVTSNPSTAANYDRYTNSVMKAALAGMVDERNLSEHDTSFSQEKEYRSAAISGVGKTGAQDKIYTGQLWVGKNSVFTIQAELVGQSQEAADKSFRDILQSIKYKGGKQIPAKPKAATTPKQNH